MKACTFPIFLSSCVGLDFGKKLIADTDLDIGLSCYGKQVFGIQETRDSEIVNEQG